MSYLWKQINTKRLSGMLLIALLLMLGQTSAIGEGARRLKGHVPGGKQFAKARHLGRLHRSRNMQLAIALKPRDPEGLADLIKRLYDPTDPAYQQYLTPEQFRERFAPTAEDVNQVTQYLASRGMRITDVHPNHLVINAEASAGTVEEALRVEIHDYSTADGRRVHAPSSEPAFGDEISWRIAGVNGLSNFEKLKHVRAKKLGTRLDATKLANPHDGLASSRASIHDYMTPAKIRTAYNLASSSLNGSGETVALFQLDGYKVSDIQAYASQFSIPMPTLVNVYVDGVNGTAYEDSLEVVLDIQLVMAIAPGVSKIMVYEGPNTASGIVNTYSKIANDNLAKQVSSSWGLPEDDAPVSMRNSEYALFQQMASQGQSVYVASGDRGAYDDEDRPTTLEVDDPASQPYVTAVGGTTLTASTAAGNYISETSWGSSSSRLGGGGGISTTWALPSWQQGLATVANKGLASSLQANASGRMVPDVALNSNPNTGYPVYWTDPDDCPNPCTGGWYAVGGTSAAAPLWAGFTALVNQNRSSRLGFLNPKLPRIAQSSAYAGSFRDIADNSTNLYYPAVTGYDLSTGWGTINGVGLLAVLSSSVLPPMPPTSINALSSAGQIYVSWSSTADATSYNVFRANALNGPYSLHTTTSTTSYADSVPPGNYYYYVTATNSAGTSGATTKVGGSPNLTQPGAPSALNATAVVE